MSMVAPASVTLSEAKSLLFPRRGRNSRSFVASILGMTAGGVFALLCTVLVQVALTERAYGANLLINESLANEPGSVTSLEWVELLNWPDTGNGSVNLKGHRLVDGRDTTWFDTSLTVPPGGFVVLARKPTGSGSFESFWGDSSGAWGDAPGESFPVVATKISLRNTNDTVTLISPAGDTSRMIWMHDAGDGISIERIRPNHDDEAANFAFCRDPSGSTPGKINSVFPVRGDLALDSLRVLPVDPKWSDTLTLIAHVTNVGLGTVASAQVKAYDDAVPSQTGDTLMPVGTVSLPHLDEQTSDSVVILWPNPSPGPHTFIARIVADGSELNNTASVSVTVRFSQPLVIITEFLANPTVGGPDEWIEISNRAGFPINMTGVRIGDSSETSRLPDSLGTIGPGDFWVLAENETAFRAHYPTFAGRLLLIANWHELNNTGDRIRLAGTAGEIIDSVSFRTTCDNDRSVERTDLAPTLAPGKYWKGSIDPSGSTPGRSNSVFPIYNDLALDSLTISPVEPTWGQPITVNFHVTNTGLDPTSSIRIDLYEDLDLSNPGMVLERIGSGDIPSLEEGAGTIVAITWDNASPGIHRLVGWIVSDGDSLNNTSAAIVTVRHSQPLVIISEYLANPETAGPGEWVEISNQADFPISMTATRIGDSSEASSLPPWMGRMAPGTFWVLCESETLFRSFYSGFSGTLIEIPYWRELNNGGDRLRLLGAAGEIIDSVSFRTIYEDNHSVERLELSAALAGVEDWAESVDPSGATPGRANSVSRELAGPFQVTVSPNPIYLSSGQPAQIDYRMEIGQQLTLKIFDRAGHLIRTIADKTPSATGTASWDGTDDRGGQVRPGPYILLARSDPQGAARKIAIAVGP